GRVVIDEQRARTIALEQLVNPTWEPALTKVEDAGDAWRVFYNSRIYVETGNTSHALAGNLPLLVSKETGNVEADLSYLPKHPTQRKVDVYAWADRDESAWRKFAASGAADPEAYGRWRLAGVPVTWLLRAGYRPSSVTARRGALP